jgi:hypothetical protein
MKEGMDRLALNIYGRNTGRRKHYTVFFRPVSEIPEQRGLAGPSPSRNKGISVRILHSTEGMEELIIQFNVLFFCH